MGRSRKNLPEVSAVYRMYSGKTCIYVGCSRNLRRRITCHKLRNRYTKLQWEECEADQLLAREMEWIYEFKPTLNRANAVDPASVRAKRHPRYIFGTKAGTFVHLMQHLECRWIDLHNAPRKFQWISRTTCGSHFHFSGNTRTSNELPKDAVVCGRCLGVGPSFKRNGKFSEERKAARAALKSEAA